MDTTYASICYVGIYALTWAVKYRFTKPVELTNAPPQRLRLFIPRSLRDLGRVSSQSKHTSNNVRTCSYPNTCVGGGGCKTVVFPAEPGTRAEYRALSSWHDNAPAYTGVDTYACCYVVNADSDTCDGAVAIPTATPAASSATTSADRPPTGRFSGSFIDGEWGVCVYGEGTAWLSV